MPNNNKINICFFVIIVFQQPITNCFLVFYAEKIIFFDAKRFCLLLIDGLLFIFLLCGFRF